MATRLATQRNYVIAATATINKNNRKSSLTTTTASGGEIITIASTASSSTTSTTLSSPSSSEQQLKSSSSSSSSSSQANLIPLGRVLGQKKLLLQTDSSGVAVIDVLPLDPSESSSNTSPTHHITTADVTTMESELSPTTDNSTSSSSIPQQQVGAHVTVVPSQSSPNEGSNHRFITVTLSADNTGNQESYQVQYVDPELYHGTSQNQNQMTYPFCAVGDYQTNNQSYYATTGNYTAATNTSATSHASTLPYIVPVDESLLLTSSQNRDSPQNLRTAEVAAYIQENHNAQQTPTSTTSTTISETENTPNITHATRISPATVAWLLENYETAEGVSLPRSTLYNHYMQHCNENKLDAVNAASFGKLIRSVFTGLRTRRLGTRGNSKYHYYGIRVKPGSTLVQAMEEKPQNYPSNSGNMHGMNKGIKKAGAKPETYEACSQYLGDGAGAIPIIPNIEKDSTMSNDITLEDIEIFRSMYREHCELFLDAILNLEFSTIESLWKEFWRSSDNNNIDESEEEKYLSKAKLYLLCQYKNVQDFIKQVDFTFYQNMVEVLIPDVLRSIPNALTQAIRNFAKNLEIWLYESMNGCPEKIIKIKHSAVSAFCQTLRRYTSLNHLAQAARAVLQNSSQIAQMLNDLNRVDFHNVQEQAAWVCQCDTATVQRLENDFKASLQQQNTLEQWAAWLRLVVDSALEEFRGKPNYAKAARQFLLKWSFYSSMVIRDLTLRSASSFGSFHLIRLLYDEYMFFLIEHKVAEAQQTTAIAVISDSDKRQTSMEFDFSYPVECNNIKQEPNPKRMKC